jgi:uncharacterized membrane protein YozB (DUF420 family)
MENVQETMFAMPLLAQANAPAALPGFIPGANGSFMLDFVFTAMFGILLALGYSIYLVKYRRKYELHKRLQLVLASVLLVAVLAFEIDMRFFTDWEVLASRSRFYVENTWDAVWISLTVHLCFAIPTPVVWIYVIVQALRKFPNPAAPGKHSADHKFWGWLAAAGMLLTAITGWIFYVLAFMS